MAVTNLHHLTGHDQGPGASPFGLGFFNAMWLPSRRRKVVFVLKRRVDAAAWDGEGTFHSPRKAERALRDLARRCPAAEFRVRTVPRPSG